MRTSISSRLFIRFKRSCLVEWDKMFMRHSVKQRKNCITLQQRTKRDSSCATPQPSIKPLLYRMCKEEWFLSRKDFLPHFQRIWLMRTQGSSASSTTRITPYFHSSSKLPCVPLSVASLFTWRGSNIFMCGKELSSLRLWWKSGRWRMVCTSKRSVDFLSVFRWDLCLPIFAWGRVRVVCSRFPTKWSTLKQMWTLLAPRSQVMPTSLMKLVISSYHLRSQRSKLNWTG